jgi:hypothetical protein
MDAVRKQAYRHLIYISMLDMRCSPPTPIWWSFRRWREIYAELCRAKGLANCFRNLALYSVRDFQDFDEAMWWQNLGRIMREYQARSNYDYRCVFDSYLLGTIYSC